MFPSGTSCAGIGSKQETHPCNEQDRLVNDVWNHIVVGALYQVYSSCCFFLRLGSQGDC